MSLFTLCSILERYLYKSFKAEIPELSPSDFNVIFIAPEYWVTSSTYENYSKIAYKHPRINKNATDLKIDFHAVLEYNGRIYDLDYTKEPTPIDKADYIANYFYSKNKKHEFQRDKPLTELRAVVVPGKHYLNYKFILPRRQSFYERMVRVNNSYSFLEYFTN